MGLGRDAGGCRERRHSAAIRPARRRPGSRRRRVHRRSARRAAAGRPATGRPSPGWRRDRATAAAARCRSSCTAAAGFAGGAVTLDASSSSQLVSGLMLAAPRYSRGIQITHQGERIPSAPHIAMTAAMLTAAGADVESGRQAEAARRHPTSGGCGRDGSPLAPSPSSRICRMPPRSWPRHWSPAA